jgi:ATP-binding cassette subfamily F protein 3
LVFVSHNRSFVRQLASRIWNVEGGHVETYPGTLDEYLAGHRGDKGGAASPEPRPSTSEAAPRVQAVPSPGEGQGETRELRRARKREEAQRRDAVAKTVGPLRKRVQELEQRIEALEQAQRQRNLDLADPEVYADDARRYALLDAYQRDAAELAEATDAWEMAQVELEAAQT